MHNEIDINASAETVWSHLVQAKLWYQWCSFAEKVKIWGASEVLEKNTRFSYTAYDLPQDRVLLEVPPEPMSSKVFEFVPESRLRSSVWSRSLLRDVPLLAPKPGRSQ